MLIEWRKPLIDASGRYKQSLTVKNFQDLVKNDLPEVWKHPFALIIGEAPSKGARSPILWNKVFDSTDLVPGARMFAADVAASNVEPLLIELERHKNFLGAAITAPYKMSVAQNPLVELDLDTSATGAVNLIRPTLSGDDCVFRGFNTDIAGIKEVCKKYFYQLSDGHIVILGNGGVARACCVAIKSLYNQKKIIQVSRRIDRASRGISSQYLFEDLYNVLPGSSLIVNCTTLGNKAFSKNSPISSELMGQLSQDTKILDLNYDPPVNDFGLLSIRNKIHYVNGLDVNLTQAAISFQMCCGNTRGLSIEYPQIIEIMNQ